MKKISQIETGGRFLYGGIEWVKLYAGDGTVAISAEPRPLNALSTKTTRTIGVLLPCAAN